MAVMLPRFARAATATMVAGLVVALGGCGSDDQVEPRLFPPSASVDIDAAGNVTVAWTSVVNPDALEDEWCDYEVQVARFERARPGWGATRNITGDVPLRRQRYQPDDPDDPGECYRLDVVLDASGAGGASVAWPGPPQEQGSTLWRTSVDSITGDWSAPTELAASQTQSIAGMHVLHRQTGTIAAWGGYDGTQGAAPVRTLVSNYPLEGGPGSPGPHRLADGGAIWGLKSLPAAGALLVYEYEECVTGLEFSADSETWSQAFNFCPDGEVSTLQGLVATNQDGAADMFVEFNLELAPQELATRVQRLTRRPGDGTWSPVATIYEGGPGWLWPNSLALDTRGAAELVFETTQGRRDQDYCERQTHRLTFEGEGSDPADHTTDAGYGCAKRVLVGTGNTAAWIEQGPMVDDESSLELWLRGIYPHPQLYQTLEGRLARLGVIHDPDGGAVLWWDEHDAGRWVAVPDWE